VRRAASACACRRFETSRPYFAVGEFQFRALEDRAPAVYQLWLHLIEHFIEQFWNRRRIVERNISNGSLLARLAPRDLSFERARAENALHIIFCQFFLIFVAGVIAKRKFLTPEFRKMFV
jgi:hypothetical protein